MSDWKTRYEAYKKGMGYKNKDVANLLNRKVNSIEVSNNNKKNIMTTTDFNRTGEEIKYENGKTFNIYSK